MLSALHLELLRGSFVLVGPRVRNSYICADVHG